MSLSNEQFARAAAAEASQLRVQQLQRMNHRELQLLLGGDPAEIVPWLRFGRMLLAGQGVERDAALALTWFNRAAEQRNPDAMNMVGRCHENGWGTPLDLELAAHWYECSAKRRHDWGQYNFANMLFDGRGVAVDQPQAVRWYRLAAHQNHARAMNLLGRCYEEGWGCEKNLAAAFHWYRRSAQGGYYRGQWNHAAALAERGLKQEAAEWFRKAAEAAKQAAV
jgi:uncharacterized protein